ncbi:transcription factor Atf31 [Schizosaccharomyces cryophilus OY26]|uniref:Transcription factor Atf31 n=1 Tax=Schizosaccharomyces cryophilus (strain OY26 / ATCC MYA-4695 / CBS 11777 / NBRC 106824 / NRRL Y48691) TaxID=653667 RepID=S9XAB0_SCHCR|nr:transcription factor Atf31 [Schizosaccharomyces cryophilus OY26]EPY54097.1 transcription factor Atf31 [Schizosaccharomyces cryophilus OY26]
MTSTQGKLATVHESAKESSNPGINKNEANLPSYALHFEKENKYKPSPAFTQYWTNQVVWEKCQKFNTPVFNSSPSPLSSHEMKYDYENDSDSNYSAPNSPSAKSDTSTSERFSRETSILDTPTQKSLAKQGEEFPRNKKVRNREAAHKCRVRKKRYIDDLQKRTKHYTTENKSLLKEANSLREEIVRLRMLIMAHRKCPVTAACDKTLLMMGKKPVSSSSSDIPQE